MKSICVFAGSSLGTLPAYRFEASRLGEEIARKGLRLVYGGSKIGLMGAVADAALAQGGEVIGVMPKGLFESEICHTGLTEFVEVADMHERKAKMGELSDAFIALPGGLGTFEELFEVASWAQIGIHKKPIGLLSVDGYYQPLLRLVLHSIEGGFVPESSRDLLSADESAVRLIEKLQSRVQHDAQGGPNGTFEPIYKN